MDTVRVATDDERAGDLRCDDPDCSWCPSGHELVDNRGRVEPCPRRRGPRSGQQLRADARRFIGVAGGRHAACRRVRVLEAENAELRARLRAIDQLAHDDG